MIEHDPDCDRRLSLDVCPCQSSYETKLYLVEPPRAIAPRLAPMDRVWLVVVLILFVAYLDLVLVRP